MEAIKVEHLSFGYTGDVPILEDVNLKIDEGDYVILTGENGSGKSTFLKLVLGQLSPNQGKIELLGRDMAAGSFRGLKIGYVPQNSISGNQDFPATVEEVMRTGLYRPLGKRLSRKECNKRVLQALTELGMEDFLKRRIGELSGGQQQRVALARIMAYSPDVILLDEPFSALDVFLKDHLQQELEELLKDYEGTVIMVSHSRDEVYRFCEELLILDHGSVITAGKTKEIFSNPQYRAAAKLTGCKNFAEIQYTESPNKIILPDWGVTLQLKEEVPKGYTCIGYRAHDFVPVWGEKKENCIEVRLKSMSELPFENQYYLNPSNPKTPSICWFVQREKENVVETNGLPEYLQIAEERLMFLK